MSTILYLSNVKPLISLYERGLQTVLDKKSVIESDHVKALQKAALKGKITKDVVTEQTLFMRAILSGLRGMKSF
jgi:hypothetical protein